jgi:predicted MPP superfamily phosphohydrolase
VWDPLTPLDKVLLSPLAAIVQSIYAFLLVLRGSPFKPPQHKPPIRVVCISDTHTSTPNVPAGDLLVHAGDLTNAGNVEEIQAQIDWLDSLPHRYKIFIAGNHDSFFDPSSRKAEDKGKKLDFKGLHYLQNSSLHLKFKGGRSLDVWGSANIPKCGGSDFA